MPFTNGFSNKSKGEKVKIKSCKICKVKFEPFKPLQQVCSPACAILLAEKNKGKNEKREKTKIKKELRESAKTISTYRKELQIIINKIVREIDAGFNCISSGRPYKTNDQAGHYYSVGAYQSLRFNLHNIYSQSVADNLYKSGNPIGFTQGLIREFGEDWLKLVTKLPEQYREIKLDKEDIKQSILNAKGFLKIVQEYKKENELKTSHRIYLRNLGNKTIGIYAE
jgi:hypothetical protein